MTLRALPGACLSRDQISPFDTPKLKPWRPSHRSVASRLLQRPRQGAPRKGNDAPPGKDQAAGMAAAPGAEPDSASI